MNITPCPWMRAALTLDGKEVAPEDVIGRAATIVTKHGRTYRDALIRGYSSNAGRLVIYWQLPNGVMLHAYVPVADLAPGSEIRDDIQPAPTMTVRVGNRGTGRSYQGVWVSTVTIVATCPRCGEPRGTTQEGRIVQEGGH